MYCKCGAENKDGAENCAVCGREISGGDISYDFFASPSPAPAEEPPSIEFEPVSVPEPFTELIDAGLKEIPDQESTDEKADYLSFKSASTPIDRGSTVLSRFMLMTLAAIVVFLVPLVIMKRQIGDRVSSFQPATISDTLNGAGNGGARAGKEGEEVAAPPVRKNIRITPESAFNMANNAGRKANVQKMAMVVATLYAQQGAYPSSVLEIPADMLGFNPDPNIYEYSVTSEGFKVKAVMEGDGGPGDENLFMENGVVKYVMKGD